MANQNMLENAIRIAVTAHAGQFDKGGNPYILHPLHVMEQMDTEEEKVVAVLHDVIEDTNMDEDTLRAAGISDVCLDAIKLLTKKPDTEYQKYIINIKRNEIARKVKLADMRHNSDLTRIHVIEEKHLKMIKKYHWATLVLRGEA
jgi:(p)ppGpp synthase/HD superfamily hydrolase